MRRSVTRWSPKSSGTPSRALAGSVSRSNSAIQRAPASAPTATPWRAGAGASSGHWVSSPAAAVRTAAARAAICFLVIESPGSGHRARERRQVGEERPERGVVERHVVFVARVRREVARELDRLVLLDG